MEDEKLVSLRQTLRALVVSTPGTMTVSTLLRDYRSMLGAALPISEYGYSDPIAFLRELCEDQFVLEGAPWDPILTPKITNNLRHLDLMVRSQRVRSNKHILRRRSVSGTRSSRMVLKEELPARYPPVRREHRPVRREPNFVTQFRKIALKHKDENDSKFNKETYAHTEYTEYTDRDARFSSSSAERDRRSKMEEEIMSLKRSLIAIVASSPPLTVRELVKFHSNIPPLDTYGYSDPIAFMRDWCEDIFKLQGSPWDPIVTLRVADLEHIDQVLRRRPARPRTHSQEDCSLNSHPRAAFKSLQGPSGVPAPALRSTAAGLSSGPPGLRNTPAGLSCGPPGLRRPREPYEAPPAAHTELEVIPGDCMQFTESIPPLLLGSLAQPVGAGGELAQPGGALLEEGPLFMVIIGEVYSPSHFWIIRVGPHHNQTMEETMDDMTSYYQKEGAKRVLPRGALRAGQVCAAEYCADWHRATIEHVAAQTVKVRHVDYGTVDTVSAGSLRPLRREWGALPAQAVRARLAGCRPTGVARRWSRVACRDFLDHVRGMQLYAKVVAVDHEERIVETFLTDVSRDEDLCLTQEFIRLQHADWREDSALTSDESYLYPRFAALECGATPNYGEIQGLLDQGIEVDYVEAYRRHVTCAM